MEKSVDNVEKSMFSTLILAIAPFFSQGMGVNISMYKDENYGFVFVLCRIYFPRVISLKTEEKLAFSPKANATHPCSDRIC